MPGVAMDIVDRYERALAAFGSRVHQVGDDQWHLPTPCDAWDVRALVNHVVGENVWAVELFEGRTVAEVGDRLDGDLVGDDPVGAWDRSAAGSLAAVRAPGAMERTVHLSFGDHRGDSYAEQLAADLLVHGWDLARATGLDERLDPELVAACADWFAGWEAGYRQAGVIAARPDVQADDPQALLLAAFGRDPSPAPR